MVLVEILFPVIFNKSQYIRLIEQQANHNCLFLPLHTHVLSHTIHSLLHPFRFASILACFLLPASLFIFIFLPHFSTVFHLDSSIHGINWKLMFTLLSEADALYSDSMPNENLHGMWKKYIFFFNQSNRMERQVKGGMSKCSSYFHF